VLFLDELLVSPEDEFLDEELPLDDSLLCGADALF
jgi:hypothetical protein